MEDDARKSKIVRFFSRHLVSLSIAYVRKDEGEDRPRFKAYAGTLIRIHDIVFYLTAGHVLRRVEEALNSPDVDIKRTGLADLFGPNQHGDFPVPLDLRETPLHYIDDDSEGLDFGVIALHPLQARLLENNGMIALDEQRWKYQHTVEFDAYEMLGLPHETASTYVSPTGKGFVTATMIPIRRLAAPPANATPTNYPRFVGEIIPEIPIKSIKGMSGGPIFGYSYRNGELRYWVVALQSAYLENTPVVFGCPLPILAQLLSNWITSMIPAAKQQSRRKKTSKRAPSKPRSSKRQQEIATAPQLVDRLTFRRRLGLQPLDRVQDAVHAGHVALV